MSGAGESPAAEARAPLEARAASALTTAGALPRSGRPPTACAAPPRARPARRVAAEALRMIGGLALVMAATCALLWTLDGVPTWIAGDARGVRKAVTVEDAERILRARLVLPAYFPATFAWPPARIRLLSGSPGAVALWVEGRGGGPGLFLAETTGPGPIPAQLVPEAQPLDRARVVTVGPSAGTLSRVVEEGGLVAWELAWEQGGRSLLLRSRARADELFRMARSAREAQ